MRLDTEYISNWNFGLDIKILFKTVMTVLKREGRCRRIQRMFYEVENMTAGLVGYDSIRKHLAV